MHSLSSHGHKVVAKLVRYITNDWDMKFFPIRRLSPGFDERQGDEGMLAALCLVKVHVHVAGSSLGRMQRQANLEP